MKRNKLMAFYIASIISILVMTGIILRWYAPDDNKTMPSKASPYRLACVYSGASDYYKASLEEGLKQAAQENGIWVDFISLKSNQIDKHCTELDKAIASKVDGIITNIPDAGMIEPYIDKAGKNKIPVILIESDLPGSKRISFIGTYEYEFGENAARLLMNSSGKSKIANFKNATDDKYDLKDLGFRDTLPKDMETEMFIANEDSVIEYTNLAQTILVRSDINSFFCPNAESTLGVVRAMIEFNKTNSTVIGAGDSQEILQYVKSGLLYASLAEDSFSIGHLAVNNMLKYLKGESISDSINPKIIIITKDNADKVIDERKARVNYGKESMG